MTVLGLISTRWVDIPEDEIYHLLSRVPLAGWKPKVVTIGNLDRYFLSSGDYAYPYSLPLATIYRLSHRLNQKGELMLDWKAKTQFLKDNPRLNNASQYGIKIVPKPNSTWLASVYHLTPDENRGGHFIFIEVLNKEGNRETFLPIYWGWEGMSQAERNRTGAIFADKPANEIKSHPIFANQHIWLRIYNGDRIENIHVTVNPDQLASDGSIGNSQNHHSYLVLFQEVSAPPDPEPQPEPEPDKQTATELLSQIRELLIDLESLLDEGS